MITLDLEEQVRGDVLRLRVTDARFWAIIPATSTATIMGWGVLLGFPLILTPYWIVLVVIAIVSVVLAIGNLIRNAYFYSWSYECDQQGVTRRAFGRAPHTVRWDEICLVRDILSRRWSELCGADGKVLLRIPWAADQFEAFYVRLLTQRESIGLAMGGITPSMKDTAKVPESYWIGKRLSGKWICFYFLAVAWVLATSLYFRNLLSFVWLMVFVNISVMSDIREFLSQRFAKVRIEDEAIVFGILQPSTVRVDAIDRLVMVSKLVEIELSGLGALLEDCERMPSSTLLIYAGFAPIEMSLLNDHCRRAAVAMVKAYEEYAKREGMDLRAQREVEGSSFRVTISRTNQ